MKQERRRVFCFLCSSTTMIAGTLGPAKAADPYSDSKNTEKVVDAYITVMTMAYPPAGAALAAAKGLMSTLGFFSKPDPVAEAIKAINARLDAIDARIDSLEKNLQETRNEVFRNANLQNTRELRRHRNAIEQVLLGLKNKPTDKYTKEKLVLDAKQVCDAMLEDRKIWVWSDLVIKEHTWEGKKVKAGTMLDPDFKPMPALEIYSMALATWMASIEHAGGGNTAYVKRTFGKDLQRHIDYLTVRPNWREFASLPVAKPGEVTTPNSLPEQIQARVMGYYVPTSRTAGPDRIGTLAEYTRDSMAREVKYVGYITYTTRAANELINVPTGLLNRSTPKEDEIETNYGLDVMELLAQKLKRLRDRGTLREQYIGTFNPTFSSFATIYAVGKDGNLRWMRDDIGTAPAKANSAEKLQVSRKLTEPKVVGYGWNDFQEALPGGASTFYGLRKNGDLLWYSHDDYLKGGGTWRGPVKVGNGWNSFTKVVPMGDGVLYGILPDGTLRWNRHNTFKTGTGGYGGWAQPSLNVSMGWSKYKKVFGGGNGVIYAVAQDGKLLWFHHDYLTPKAFPTGPNSMVRSALISAWAKTWKGPKEIGTGWDSFTQLFSSGEGDIYGVLPSGELRGYKHVGWKDGSPTWGNYVTMSNDWNQYLYSFASMPSNAIEDRVIVR